MMYNSILIFYFMMICQLAFAQPEKYCDDIRAEFYKAVDDGHLAEIEYRYYKILNACEITPKEMGLLAGCFESKGYDITWRKDKSFAITYIPSSWIDNNLYFKAFHFQQLPAENHIIKKFKTLDNFFKTLQIDSNELAEYPVFLPAYKIIWLKYYDQDVILNDQSYKEIVNFGAQKKGLNYGGNGIFYFNDEKTTRVYRAAVENNKPTFKKLIDAPGSTKIIPISNDLNHIAVWDFLSEDMLTKVYDHHGKILFDKQKFIDINSVSKTLTLNQNGIYRLYDFALKPILPDAQYIIEVNKESQSYFVHDDLNSQRNLYDLTGKKILSSDEYSSIYINKTPYALVTKANQYALIDFVHKNVLAPFRQEKIHELTPGFLATNTGENWIIFDESNRKLANIKAKEIRTLTARAQLLIIVQNEHNRVGLCNVFGKEILQQQYDAIEYDELYNTLTVTLGQVQFKTDLQGKKIK